MKRQLLYKIFGYIANNQSINEYVALIRDPRFYPEVVEEPYVEVYLHGNNSATRIPKKQTCMTAIHIAAINGNVEVLKLFSSLFQAVNYDVETNTGWTPLMYASRQDKPNVVQFLLDQKAQYNKTNHDNGLLREYAAMKLANTTELYELYPLQEDNAASIAIKHGNRECFKLLYPLHNEEEKKLLEKLAIEYDRKDMLESVTEENYSCPQIKETADILETTNDFNVSNMGVELIKVDEDTSVIL